MKLAINWKQPSTQRGLAILAAGILQMFGQEISADSIQTAVGALMTVAGAIGVLRSDPPAPVDTPTAPATPVADNEDRWRRDP